MRFNIFVFVKYLRCLNIYKGLLLNSDNNIFDKKYILNIGNYDFVFDILKMKINIFVFVKYFNDPLLNSNNNLNDPLLDCENNDFNNPLLNSDNNIYNDLYLILIIIYYGYWKL